MGHRGTAITHRGYNFSALQFVNRKFLGVFVPSWLLILLDHHGT